MKEFKGVFKLKIREIAMEMVMVVDLVEEW